VQEVLGLGDDLWTNDKLESYGCANFLKGGLVYADELTTVSPNYSKEIQTAYYGERLDGLLRARSQSLTGILNGIDVNEYNPQTDPYLRSTYEFSTLQNKALNKTELQQKLGLEVRGEVPLFGMVTRLSNQKGLDLIDRIIGELMQRDIQLVVLGMGDSQYVDLFTWAQHEYPGRVAARFTMDHVLAHQIYGGVDFFLMPSQFEPCGLSQMISMRYGTIPIVRETGGLRDTVLSYNDYTKEGNGFTFFNYNAHDMLATIDRAVAFYHNYKDIILSIQQRGMETDFSWDHSSLEYIALYEKLMPENPTPDQISSPKKKKEEPEKPAKKAVPDKKKAPVKKATEKPAPTAQKTSSSKASAPAIKVAPEKKAPAKPAAKPTKKPAPAVQKASSSKASAPAVKAAPEKKAPTKPATKATAATSKVQPAKASDTKVKK
ncbi:MAG: glycosyltransferase, partial [Clostridiales bacterium]|nr:glycosyltransferase [Clostridiales bacterium]